MNSAPNEIHKYANRYLDIGLSIFPVILKKDANGKIEKRPAVEWKKYIERHPTKDELQDWFIDKKFTSIGMATGKISGLVVIDIESYADEETFDMFGSQMVTQTISGGKHLFYKFDEELRNTVKLFGKDVDFRGDGGYVVLPPSAIDNQSYKWEKAVKDFSTLNTLPNKIKNELKKKPLINSSLPVNIIMPDDTDMPFSNSGEGGRNDMASRVAGTLLASIPRRFWNSSAWLTLKDWNLRNNPPLPEDELRRTFESIKSTDLNHYSLEGLREKEDMYKIYSGLDAETEYSKMQQTYGEGLETGFSFLDDYFRFLPEQLYLISAETHVGKTSYSLNMCARIAKKGKKVLFISLEQGIFVVPRVKSMVGIFPKTLQIMTTTDMARPEDIVEIISNMKEKPELVAIDHLHFFKRNGNGMTQDIDETIIKIQNMAKQLQLPVIIIAHMRKLQENKVPTMNDLRDSSSLSQVPSVVLLLWRKQNEEDFMDKSYLSPFGALFIAKNRVQGKTGMIPFEIKDSGRFILNGSDDSPIQEGLIVTEF